MKLFANNHLNTFIFSNRSKYVIFNHHQPQLESGRDTCSGRISPCTMWRGGLRHGTLTKDYHYGTEVSVEDVKDNSKALEKMPKNIYKNNLKNPSMDFKDLPSKGV